MFGSAPGWEDPWSRRRPANARRGRSEWEMFLVDEDGCLIDETEVQRAGLPVVFH